MPTRPGLHPNFEISRYPRELWNAIYRISDHFYVTRGFDPEFVGNSEYYAILVRPTDEGSIYLNTDRELIVIFSKYETFEIRTLEAYDRFFHYTDSARIDQSIRFLISADDKIEQSIRQYLSQNQEYPVVVPLTFAQINNQRNALISAVQNNYLVRDLFGFQSPLREDHYFFGRENVVNSVIDSALSGQNSSLFGLRKSGKTSTIFAIIRRAKSRGVHSVVFDCQDVAVHGRDCAGLLFHMVAKVRQSLSLKAPVKPNLEDLVEVSEWFSATMAQTLGSIKSKLLIIFDEIENISPRTAASDHWRNGRDPAYFWQIIRSFLQAKSNGNMSVCLVGTSPHLIEQTRIAEIDNPVYLFAPKTFIPNLTFDETREMVRRLGFFMGLEFSDSAISKLQREYGGHPFFIRQVCSKIHGLAPLDRPRQVNAKLLEDAEIQFRGQLNSYLSEILKNLNQFYPEECNLLRAIANDQLTEIKEFATYTPDLIDHLLGYGLIVLRSGEVELNFAAVRQAVQELVAQPESPELRDMWTRLCTRRGVIEQDIRRALYFTTMRVKLEDFILKLQKSLSLRRFEDLTSYEPSVLFSNTASPLYLTDIMQLLKDHELSPVGNLDSEFFEALNKVNRLRKDAHALNISEREMRDFSVACDTVESKFGLNL